jgi:Fic family protein
MPNSTPQDEVNRDIGNDDQSPSDATAAADALYSGFPDFTSWLALTIRNDLWDRALDNLKKERSTASPESLKNSIDVVIRAAAIDTGAIEGLYEVDRGFTMTVALESIAWQAQLEERGEDVTKLFQAQLSAYELVLDAATKNTPISEVWIRRVHDEICATQDTYKVLTPVGVQEQTLPKGEYKTNPNHVRLADGTVHAYAPVGSTAAEMARLVEQLKSPKFQEAHPALQVAYSHYCLTAVHPFADGNGRVARAVASSYYYRTAGTPLIVFADQRTAYLRTLREADAGNFQSFIDFIFQRGLAGLSLVTELLQTSRGPAPELIVRDITDVLTGVAGLSHQALDEILVTIIETLEEEFHAKIHDMALPTGMEGLALIEDSSRPRVEGFRPSAESPPTALRISFSTQSPARANAYRYFVSYVSKAKDETSSFLLRRTDGKDELRFDLEDLYPQLSAATMIRITNLAERTVAEMLTELLGAATKSFNTFGAGFLPSQ